MENIISLLGIATVGGNGIALLQELVNSMQGEMKLKKEADFDTTFVITLPKNIDSDHQLFSKTHKTFIQKVEAVLQKNMSDETFGILELCRAMCLSRSQLHNKIKAATGLSTSLYVRVIKLEKAKILLTHSEMNVSEVAYEVGYKDPSYFSRLFFEKYGYSPSKVC